MRLFEMVVELMKQLWTRLSRQKVKKLSKVEKPQSLKKLQRSLVWRNVYQNTNPPSICYKKLELLSGSLNPGALSISLSNQLSTRQSLPASVSGTSSLGLISLHQSLYLRNARLLFATSILEMRSGRRCPSPGTIQKCLMD